MKTSQTLLALLLLFSLSFAACGDDTEEPEENDDNGDEQTDEGDDEQNEDDEGNEGDETVPVESDIEGYMVYESADGSYQISYPEGWVVDDTTAGVVYFQVMDASGANVNIMTSADPGMDLNEFVDMSMEMTKEMIPDIVEGGREDVTVDGYEGIMVTYSGMMMEMNMDWSQWLIPVDGQLYIVTFTELTDGGISHMEEAMTMVDSMKFAN